MIEFHLFGHIEDYTVLNLSAKFRLVRSFFFLSFFFFLVCFRKWERRGPTLPVATDSERVPSFTIRRSLIFGNLAVQEAADKFPGPDFYRHWFKICVFLYRPVSCPYTWRRIFRPRVWQRASEVSFSEHSSNVELSARKINCFRIPCVSPQSGGSLRAS